MDVDSCIVGSTFVVTAVSVLVALFDICLRASDALNMEDSIGTFL